MDLKPTIVFDLDGTLVDSVDDLRSALNATLQLLDRPALDRTAVSAMIGDGARKLLERALEATGGLPNDFTAPFAHFHASYEAGASTLTRPYPDVPDVLASLRAAGW